MTVIDINKYHGCEVLADLNYPQALGEFDFVIDNGTTEHCFNVAQAMLNAVNAMKVGGHILHTAPITQINHGFYNFSPIFFKLFYQAAGIEMLKFELYDTPQHPIPSAELFGGEVPIRPDVWALVIGRKVVKKLFAYPVQEQWKCG